MGTHLGLHSSSHIQQLSDMKFVFTLSIIVLLQTVISRRSMLERSKLDRKQASQVLRQNLKRSKRGWFDGVVTEIAVTAAPVATTDSDTTTSDPTTTIATTTRNPKEVQQEDADAFLRENNLSTVESWEEYKDKLESNTAIPEEEVDELERCCTSCWWNNGFTKIYGRSHHELTELAEKSFEKTGQRIQVPTACPKCYRHIPKHFNAPVKGLIKNVSRIKNVMRLLSGTTG